MVYSSLKKPWLEGWDHLGFAEIYWYKYAGTMRGPQGKIWFIWFINPMNKVAISTINHSYRLGAPTLQLVELL